MFHAKLCLVSASIEIGGFLAFTTGKATFGLGGLRLELDLVLVVIGLGF